jgi:glutamyl-tRNA reductase
MQLFSLGLDYTTAPVDVREQLAFSPERLAEALQKLTTPTHGIPLLQEAAILSTCNRVEIYGVAEEGVDVAHELVAFLEWFHDTDRALFGPCLAVRYGVEAAHHLCNTASGLNSMVLGEPQIQGQVREAIERARAQGAAKRVLDCMFRHALSAGKAVRSQTDISRHAASVSHAAVELARKLFGPLEHCRVLLVGSGEMSTLAARNLLDNGARDLLVVNRSFARGQELAEHFSGQAFTFDDLPEALAQADIVISSTAAPHAVIFHHHVAEALARRPERPLFLIDLAVPRDIDAEVAALPGAHVYDMDDLHALVNANLERRRNAVEAAELLISQEVDKFYAWFNALEVQPTLVDLRHWMDDVRKAEVERTLRRLGDLPPDVQKAIDAMSLALINKLLHPPTTRLRQEASQGDCRAYVDTVRALFGLDGYPQYGSQIGEANA